MFGFKTITFFIIGLSVVFSSNAEDLCRQHLASVICFKEEHQTPEPTSRDPVAAFVEQRKLYQEPDCKTLKPEFVQEFLATYDRLPPISKQLLCDIKSIIVIEKTTFGAAVGPFYDLTRVKLKESFDLGDQFYHSFEVHPIGSFLHINLDRFSVRRSFLQWMNEKIQSLFFPMGNLAMLPIFTAPQEETLLYANLLHETGHLLQYANKSFDTWFDFSFVRVGKYNRIQIKYPNTDLQKSAATGTPIYHSQESSEIATFFQSNGIVSLYAGVSPQEDFAETFQYILGSPYRIVREGRVEWDGTREETNNEIMGKKVKFIKDLLASPDLKVLARDHGPDESYIYISK
jgi:hypothetical protein